MLGFPSPLYAKSGGATLVTTGWRLPTTTGSLAGGGSSPWSSTSNITATGGGFAISTLNPYASTYLLRGSTFGFASESIPSGAIITALEVEVARNKTITSGVPTVKDYAVYWADSATSPTVSGLNLAATTVDWPTTSSTADPGTPAYYQWTTPSQGALTKAILEDSGFTVFVQAIRPQFSEASDSAVARVDSIRARATYYVP